MNDAGRTAPSPPPLACFGGAAAPPEMAADLRRLLALPEAARRRFWEALGPALPEPIPAGVEQRLTDFCRRFEAPDGELARALKACRHLLRAAAAVDLDRARLAEDVTRLVGEGDAPAILAVLSPGHDAARALLRAEIAQKTLADHEDLVTAIDHRVERIVASTHGDHLDLALLAVTFHKKGRGAGDERVTVRLGPEQIEELSRACERALKKSRD